MRILLYGLWFLAVGLQRKFLYNVWFKIPPLVLFPIKWKVVSKQSMPFKLSSSPSLPSGSTYSSLLTLWGVEVGFGVARFEARPFAPVCRKTLVSLYIHAGCMLYSLRLHTFNRLPLRRHVSVCLLQPERSKESPRSPRVSDLELLKHYLDPLWYLTSDLSQHQASGADLQAIGSNEKGRRSQRQGVVCQWRSRFLKLQHPERALSR